MAGVSFAMRIIFFYISLSFQGCIVFLTFSIYIMWDFDGK